MSIRTPAYGQQGASLGATCRVHHMYGAILWRSRLHSTRMSATKCFWTARASEEFNRSSVALGETVCFGVRVPVGSRRHCPGVALRPSLVPVADRVWGLVSRWPRVTGRPRTSTSTPVGRATSVGLPERASRVCRRAFTFVGVAATFTLPGSASGCRESGPHGCSLSGGTTYLA